MKQDGMNGYFEKYTNKPVFGGKDMGTCYDVYVTRDNGRFRMDFSWRPQKSLAVTFSDDGIHWEKPQITLAYDETTGWEERVSRNCVLKIDGCYKMWYTGHVRGYCYIGYAESTDGIHFRRVLKEPVLFSERNWEGTVE